MPEYYAPDVYVEEIPNLPKSISSVATSIPIFMGYTLRQADVDKAIKIHSIAEYEQTFGTTGFQPIHLKLVERVAEATGDILDSSIALDGDDPIFPTCFLYDTVKLYFANGGGPCYIFSVGPFPGMLDPSVFVNAFRIIENLDEVSLIAFPDVCQFPKEQYGDIVDAAFLHCAKMQDRFLILDVPDAVPGGNDDISKLTTNFREKFTAETHQLKYGAAYYPYLKTNNKVDADELQIIITTHSKIVVRADGSESIQTGAYQGLSLAEARESFQNPWNHQRLEAFVKSKSVTLPPSGAVLGALVRSDVNRGVWKASANISLSNVEKPQISITEAFQENLNVDAHGGKSINAIRHFEGKGILIWGARTLAGNDNEWRYIFVMRLGMMLKKSIHEGTSFVVFEPNDANTWVKVKSIIENYLIALWRDGALSGAKAEDAFFVKVGLGETMTEDDILNDRLIIQFGMAPVRPAEFIVFQTMHQLQQEPMPKPNPEPAPTTDIPQSVPFLFRIKQFFLKIFSWIR